MPNIKSAKKRVKAVSYTHLHAKSEYLRAATVTSAPSTVKYLIKTFEILPKPVSRHFVPNSVVGSSCIRSSRAPSAVGTALSTAISSRSR